MRELEFDVVVPTIGRPSLVAMLEGLAAGDGPLPRSIIVVDDRPRPTQPLAVRAPRSIADRIHVVSGGGRGPASARNVGIAASASAWVCFLDDDVVPGPNWRRRLAEDVSALTPDVAGSQGRVEVPLPSDRRPTDWERNVAGLERASWATADMAYRRAALRRVGGFDERFPRAYREDADLALRVADTGDRLVRGRRVVVHPVRAADRWASLRLQAGNADDAMMRRIHGRGWRRRGGAPPGRLPRHAMTVASGVVALAAFAIGRRRAAVPAAVAWAAGTAELAWARIAPGPHTANEAITMIATSLALPPLAVLHRLRGEIGAISWARRSRPNRRDVDAGDRPGAVLLDRDGTLVVDVPYNGDPDRVRPLPGAREALDRLRTAGLPIAVVSNQSGVARGLVTLDDVHRVNRRVEELLGPLGPWLVCPHDADARCSCRKPEPGLIVAAARRLGVRPASCIVIGDTGGDVLAARAAGARAILVPNAATRSEEIAASAIVAPSLGEAVDLVLRDAAR